LGAALLKGSCGSGDCGVEVANVVVAAAFSFEVVSPVLFEVAVAVEGAEFEDGFGAGESPAGSGEVHAVFDEVEAAISNTSDPHCLLLGQIARASPNPERG
jgi:hypothetical protein